MGIGVNYVTDHTIRRIRERWPSTQNLSTRTILQRVNACIKRAKELGELVKLPGGTYVPFSHEGNDGFIILKKHTVITAIVAEWCPEVTTYLEKKRNERHHQV